MKKIFSSIFFLLFAVIINGQDLSENPEAGKLYNEGNKLSKAGNYAGAIEKYDLALKSVNDYRVLYQKGVTLKKLRKYSEAEETFKKCIEVNPTFDLAFNGIGGTYFADGKYAEAAEAFKKFAELTTKDRLKSKANQYVSRALTKEAANVKADGKYKEATNLLNEAVKYFKFDAAYLMLAEIHVENGNFDQALSAADLALNNRKSITRGGPLYFKGKAFKGKNDLVKAKEAFVAGKKDSKYKGLCEYELKLMN